MRQSYVTVLLLGVCSGLVSAGTNCDRIAQSSYEDYPEHGCARQLCQNNRVLKYGKFDRIPVCIQFVVANGTTPATWALGKYARMAHYPKLDEFSELNWSKLGYGESTISATVNPFNPALNLDTAIRVYTTGIDESGNADVVESPVSVPYSNTGTFVVVFYYTALFHLDKGVPTAISFEYGDCSGCDDNDCVRDLNGRPTTCGFDMGDTCTQSTPTSIDKTCQPKTYVAFSGTDKKGIVLTSSSSMLTRFSKYSLSKVYDRIKPDI